MIWMQRPKILIKKDIMNKMQLLNKHEKIIQMRCKCNTGALMIYHRTGGLVFNSQYRPKMCLGISFAICQSISLYICTFSYFPCTICECSYLW